MLKRITALLGGLILTAFPLSSQDLGMVKDTISEFGSALAPSLPLTAAVGANWSDAYIGSLLGVPPHFGAGLNLGGALIPVEGMEKLIKAFSPGTELPPYFKAGVPVPAVVADARIGGIILPFDIGLKLGFLPEPVQNMVSSKDFRMEYLMYGADIRYAVVQENLILPGVSVGAGYTFMKTTLGFSPYSGDVKLGSVPYVDFNGTTDTADDTAYASEGSLVLTRPELRTTWETSVVDFKVHVDKNLIILMPYAGAGASLGLSSAGGGLYTTVDYRDKDNITVKDNQGNPLSGSGMIAALNQAVSGTALEGKLPKLDTDGISSTTSMNGWSFRLYGGTSVNLIPLTRIDLQLMYDLIGKGFGGSLGVRVQL